MAGYIPRWFTCPQAVTHPSSNLAQCRLSTLIEANGLTLRCHLKSVVYRIMRLKAVFGEREAWKTSQRCIIYVNTNICCDRETENNIYYADDNITKRMHKNIYRSRPVKTRTPWRQRERGRQSSALHASPETTFQALQILQTHIHSK